MFKVKVLVFCIQSLRAAAEKVSESLQGVDKVCSAEKEIATNKADEASRKIALKAAEAQVKVTQKKSKTIHSIESKRDAAQVQRSILAREFN